METCTNCGAKVEKCGLLAAGTKEERLVCCEHCAFNPLGCRCKYGEYGEVETELPYYEDDFEDDWDEDGVCENCYGEYGHGWSNCTCDDLDDELFLGFDEEDQA